MMFERYEFLLFLVVLVCCGNGVGKRVHLKIVVPHLIKHHHHIHTLFVNKPKPKFFKPPIFHSHHKHPYRYSTIYGRNYLRKPSLPRYAPDYPVTKLIPVVSKPIYVANTGQIVDDGRPDLYSVSEDTKPEFEKTIKQHNYKDVKDYKKIHKKEEYDLKKGKNFEHHHDDDYDFGHEDGKHGKDVFGHDGHYMKNYQQLQSGDYKINPDLVVFTTEKSLIGVTVPEYVDVSGDITGDHQGFVDEDPTIAAKNISNDYIYEDGVILGINPSNVDNFNENNVESDYLGNNRPDPNDEEGLKNYEVTENYSVEQENSAPAPEEDDEEEKADFKEEDTATDQPHTSDEELKKELNEDEIVPEGQSFESGSREPSESNEWAANYESIKDDTLKDLEEDAKEPDITSSDTKNNKVHKKIKLIHKNNNNNVPKNIKVHKNGKLYKNTKVYKNNKIHKNNNVHKNDNEHKNNKVNRNPVRPAIPSQQDDGFMQWALANGAFGLGYSKKLPINPHQRALQGQASQNMYTFYSPYRYDSSGIIRG